MVVATIKYVDRPRFITSVFVINLLFLFPSFYFGPLGLSG